MKRRTDKRKSPFLITSREGWKMYYFFVYTFYDEYGWEIKDIKFPSCYFCAQTNALTHVRDEKCQALTTLSLLL